MCMCVAICIYNYTYAQLSIHIQAGGYKTKHKMIFMCVDPSEHNSMRFKCCEFHLSKKGITIFSNYTKPRKYKPMKLS